MIDESPLAVDSPSVTAKAAILSNHPMAGDNNRHWICRTSTRHGTSCLWLAYGAGYLRVCSRHSVWNAPQLLPDTPLECGGLDIGGEVEAWLLSTKMIENPVNPALQILRAALVFRYLRTRIFLPERKLEPALGLPQIECTDPSIGRGYQQSSQGRICNRVTHAHSRAALAVGGRRHAELGRRALIQPAA